MQAAVFALETELESSRMSELNIVVAMTENHARGTLTEAMRQQLAAFGQVSFVSSATDHRSEASAELLSAADVILTGTGTAMLDDDVLDRAPKLKAIIHAAGTVRPIVKDTIYDRGIRISSQAAANAMPVAEYTLAMILLELKGVPVAERLYRAARNGIDVDDTLANHGSYGRTVGIISASNIGRRVMELLHPFDLNVLVFDPFLSDEAATELGVAKAELAELMAVSDVVSVHAPLLPETTGMIGVKELALLRDGSVLINTARGAILDQDALVAELVTGRIRAVIDVTDPEVPEADSPLWELENLVLTPHVAGSRGLELHRIGQRAVEEVERMWRGEDLRYEVTRERYRTNA
jgi:phosphoglycerate dehydrogenase-like enzyme